MARNLLSRVCSFCEHPVTLVETPRPLERRDAGYYYDELKGLIVAHAACGACEAKYLAWVDERGCAPIGGYRKTYYAREGETHFDLSFRGSFNDEPAAEDLPKWKVEKRVEWVRLGPYEGSEP